MGSQPVRGGGPGGHRGHLSAGPPAWVRADRGGLGAVPGHLGPGRGPGLPGRVGDRSQLHGPHGPVDRGRLPGLHPAPVRPSGRARGGAGPRPGRLRGPRAGVGPRTGPGGCRIAGQPQPGLGGRRGPGGRSGDEPAPARPPARPWLDPTYLVRLGAAAGALAILLVGVVPMVSASANPNADPILYQAQDGSPDPIDLAVPDSRWSISTARRSPWPTCGAARWPSPSGSGVHGSSR